MTTPDPNQQRINRYQRLIEVSLDLASTLDLNTVLQRILRIATQLSDAEEASILLYDQSNQELYFQTATNIVEMDGLNDMVVPTESLAGWVALNRQPVMVPDVAQDIRWFNQVGKTLNFPTRSLIAVPLIAKDKLIGVLEVLNKKNGSFAQDDLDTLQVLSAQAATVIENSRLFQQSDLIAELVHELRTPLASIQTITYLLQRQDINPQEFQDLIATIQRETQRLSEMTTTFLDLARIESGRMTFLKKRFDLVDLIDECIQIIHAKANESGLSINRTIEPDLPLLKADRDKIKQVLLNLLSNAVKYNHPGGTITVRVWTDENCFYISINDSGIGIAPESLPHIFEKFYRGVHTEENIPGTGLGLSITRHIIENHNGKISVQSKADEGTTFTIQLPK